MNKYLISKRGIGFTELIVAALIIVIAFAGISVMFMNIDYGLRESAEEVQAAYLAREGIEMMRETVRCDPDTDDWFPKVILFPGQGQWGVTLPYWSPNIGQQFGYGPIEQPDICSQQNSRQMRIENVDEPPMSGGEYLRRIDVRVVYAKDEHDE